MLTIPGLAAALGGFAAVRSGRNPYYEGPVSDHFDGVRFFNPGGIQPRSPFDVLRWQFGGTKQPWPEAYPSPFGDTPPPRVGGSGLRVTLVGHATVLIQTGGLNIVIDPVWSERASPVSFAGPRRVNAPGIAFDALPPIDVVLVTHNHYDHLDMATLIRLAGRDRPRIITPLGNDTIMREGGVPVAAEAFDWGARVALSDSIAVHLEPSQHWSARGVLDRSRALWAAFVIETPGGAVYHVGDTGFGDGSLFPRIRERHGPPRLAILPVGAYEPRWFMQGQHMNPDEAVRVFLACGAQHAIGHHWGTFRLTDESVDAPPAALTAALAQHGVAPERFRAMRPGEVWDGTTVG